jgi:hypothetical protein
MPFAANEPNGQGMPNLLSCGVGCRHVAPLVHSCILRDAGLQRQIFGASVLTYLYVCSAPMRENQSFRLGLTNLQLYTWGKFPP